MQTICVCRQADSSGERMAAARIGPHHQMTGVEQGIQHCLFVSATGLQDNLANLTVCQPGQQLAVAGGCVVKLRKGLRRMDSRHVLRALRAPRPRPTDQRGLETSKGA
ncbi:hypothetical protein ACFQS6_10265 [Xanthomonas populi]|nr:hypothetical protein [Xanthomonas populi]